MSKTVLSAQATEEDRALLDGVRAKTGAGRGECIRQLIIAEAKRQATLLADEETELDSWLLLIERAEEALIEEQEARREAKKERMLKAREFMRTPEERADAHREAAREYYHRNKDKYREYKKKYREEHKAEIDAYNKKYIANTKNRRRKKAVKNAAKRLSGSHSK